jgi:hypothetical protein
MHALRVFILFNCGFLLSITTNAEVQNPPVFSHRPYIDHVISCDKTPVATPLVIVTSPNSRVPFCEYKDAFCKSNVVIPALPKPGQVKPTGTVLKIDTKANFVCDVIPGPNPTTPRCPVAADCGNKFLSPALRSALTPKPLFPPPAHPVGGSR